MALKEYAKVYIPYIATAAIAVAVIMGKLSPEVGAALAIALGLPSPVTHAISVLKPKKFQ